MERVSFGKRNCYSVLNRNDCPKQLRAVVPQSNKYIYVIDEFKVSEQHCLDSLQFSATLRINLATKADAEQWLKQFMCHSKCTYRTTRTKKIAFKHLVVKFHMHCQHHRKSLSHKQKQAHLRVERKDREDLSLQE